MRRSDINKGIGTGIGIGLVALGGYLCKKGFTKAQPWIKKKYNSLKDKFKKVEDPAEEVVEDIKETLNASDKD